jgi:DNA-binding CsgD family transcriptional regulator
MERSHLIRDMVAFMSAGGMRPRALVITGETGIGKTTFVDRFQVELLASGRSSVVVIDDAAVVEESDIERVRRAVESDVRTCFIVAGETIAPDLQRLIDSTCERRVVQLDGLTDAESRSLLAELGLERWTMHAGQLLATSNGNPRTIIDRAFDPFSPDALPAKDATFDGMGWSERSARRLELVFAGASDDAAIIEFRSRCEVEAEDDSTPPSERADAEVILAEMALLDHDLEAAVQYGERAAARVGAAIPQQLLGAAHAAAARALRGEPTALLSLHALAGRAAREGMDLVESVLWFAIAHTVGVSGDVTSARRALDRSIQLADECGAVTQGLRARLMLAELHLSAAQPAAAEQYLEEILAVASHRGMHRFGFDATIDLARAAMARGDVDVACQRADQALELVMRSTATRFDVVLTAVYAARAYAAAGSVDLALAPLDALAANLGDSHSPDFWLVLEAVRVLGKAGTDPAAFQKWLDLMGTFDADGHGGALRAAHAEADAWRAAIEGRKAEAARLAERARQLWVAAECHDELPLTQPIIDQAPLEHGARISLVGTPTGGPIEDPEAFEVLTKREREIARYVAGGLTNPEIASELHLSPRTVEHHVASILRKLELPSRRALVRGQV